MSQLTGIHVSGHGRITTMPDVATFAVVVSTERADTVKNGMRHNSEVVRKVFETLEGRDIPKADVKTIGFHTTKDVEQEQVKEGNKTRYNQLFRGYNVAATISVKIRRLDVLGELIDQLMSVSGEKTSVICHTPSFDVADRTKHENAARDLAAKDAMEKANLYAATTGVKLGRLTHLSEHPQHRNMMAMARCASVEAPAGGGAPDYVPLSSGEMEITSQVSCIFSIE